MILNELIAVFSIIVKSCVIPKISDFRAPVFGWIGNVRYEQAIYSVLFCTYSVIQYY